MCKHGMGKSWFTTNEEIPSCELCWQSDWAPCFGPIKVCCCETSCNREQLSVQVHTVWHEGLRAVMKWKCPGLLINCVLLKHDNSGSHSAKMTEQLLQRFWWEILEHVAYSCDLGSSHYHFFPALKLILVTQISEWWWCGDGDDRVVAISSMQSLSAGNWKESSLMWQMPHLRWGLCWKVKWQSENYVWIIFVITINKWFSKYDV